MNEEEKLAHDNSKLTVQKVQQKATYPPWMSAERVSYSEKLEIKFY